MDARARSELEWLFRVSESEMGVRSNFDSFIIASKQGGKRARIDDSGDLVNGVQEALANEDTMIDALDARRSRSRFAATAKNRRVMAAYQLVDATHQRVLEAAYEARSVAPAVRKAFGLELAGVARLTRTARALPAWSRQWLEGAVARGDARAAQIRSEAEVLFNAALAAYGDASWRSAA